jgi:HSP20 family molecular chaperone IbpA
MKIRSELSASSRRHRGNARLFVGLTTEPIDPSRVSAEYRNGLLSVTAPLAHPATKVQVQAA